MKKLNIQSTEELNEFKSKVKIVDDLYKKTKYSGFIKLYADKVVPLYNQQFCYNYLIIMEFCIIFMFLMLNIFLCHLLKRVKKSAEFFLELL